MILRVAIAYFGMNKNFFYNPQQYYNHQLNDWEYSVTDYNGKSLKIRAQIHNNSERQNYMWVY